MYRFFRIKEELSVRDFTHINFTCEINKIYSSFPSHFCYLKPTSHRLAKVMRGKIPIANHLGFYHDNVSALQPSYFAIRDDSLYFSLAESASNRAQGICAFEKFCITERFSRWHTSEYISHHSTERHRYCKMRARIIREQRIFSRLLSVPLCCGARSAKSISPVETSVKRSVFIIR